MVVGLTWMSMTFFDSCGSKDQSGLGETYSFVSPHRKGGSRTTTGSLDFVFHVRGIILCCGCFFNWLYNTVADLYSEYFI